MERKLLFFDSATQVAVWQKGDVFIVGRGEGLKGGEAEIHFSSAAREGTIAYITSVLTRLDLANEEATPNIDLGVSFGFANKEILRKFKEALEGKEVGLIAEDASWQIH